jgi:hypothetical protein
VKTIDLATKTTSLQELLQLASEDNVTLRTPEGRFFILVELADFEQEIELTLQKRELLELLDKRSKEAGGHTSE